MANTSVPAEQWGSRVYLRLGYLLCMNKMQEALGSIFRNCREGRERRQGGRNGSKKKGGE